MRDEPLGVRISKTVDRVTYARTHNDDPGYAAARADLAALCNMANVAERLALAATEWARMIEVYESANPNGVDWPQVKADNDAAWAEQIAALGAFRAALSATTEAP